MIQFNITTKRLKVAIITMLCELKIDTNKINEDLHVLSRDIETYRDIRKRVWDFLKN